MSGSLFAPWSRVRDPLDYAIQLGKAFNCSIPTDLTNEHGKIVDCLRNISAARLMATKLNVPRLSIKGYILTSGWVRRAKPKRVLLTTVLVTIFLYFNFYNFSTFRNNVAIYGFHSEKSFWRKLYEKPAI